MRSSLATDGGVPPVSACTTRRPASATSRSMPRPCHAASQAASSAIEAAGGTVTLVQLPFKGENKAGRPAAKGNQFTNR